MYTQRNEKIVKKGGSSSTINYSLLTIHSGMTLVELLVAVSIMVLLVAVSVPMFKPMLDSQKTSGGAQTVAMALQRARVRAMETGKPCGIEFVRFTEGNEANVAYQMRLLKNANDYINDERYRLKIENGGIHFYFFNGGWDLNGGPALPGLPPPDWNTKAMSGAKIILGRQGREYHLLQLPNGGSYDTLFSPGWYIAEPDASSDLRPLSSLNLPEPNPTQHWPIEFSVVRTARPSLVPPVTMPRGSIVDLQYSGIGTDTRDIRGDAFSLTSNNRSIKIMFSPAGYVDRCVYNDDRDDIKPREPIYLCIGEWDRRMINSTDTWAEDGKSNVRAASNFWVTIHPRTGEVRVAEMAPCEAEYAAWRLAIANSDDDIADKRQAMIRAARKFATEKFVDTGGF